MYHLHIGWSILLDILYNCLQKSWDFSYFKNVCPDRQIKRNLSIKVLFIATFSRDNERPSERSEASSQINTRESANQNMTKLSSTVLSTLHWAADSLTLPLSFKKEQGAAVTPTRQNMHWQSKWNRSSFMFSCGRTGRDRATVRNTQVHPSWIYSQNTGDFTK